METDNHIFTGTDVVRCFEAVESLMADYHDKRRAKSQELFGHTGAHISSIPYPNGTQRVRTVLETFEAYAQHSGFIAQARSIIDSMEMSLDAWRTRDKLSPPSATALDARREYLASSFEELRKILPLP